MSDLSEAIAGALAELREAPNLSPMSVQRVDKWITAGDDWQMLLALDRVLRVANEAGIPSSRFLARVAFGLDAEPVPEVESRFFRDVPLPTGLTNQHLALAMAQAQKMIAQINKNLYDSAGAPLINFIQANNFSGVVSNILTDALDQVSPYKHNHDQRFPDLKNPANGVGLEMKAANKPGKGGESHNGHGGWHLIACYEMNEDSGNIRFVHIELGELVSFHDEHEGDWHYCGSTVNQETGSQRTETYYTTLRGTSKLRDGSVYLDTDRVENWSGWQHDRSSLIPPHSPLYFKRIDNRTKVPSLKNPDRLVMWSGVKSQLRKLDPLWPLYSRKELEQIGVPLPLIEVIRPQDP